MNYSDFLKRNERRLLILLAVLALIAIPFLFRHFNTAGFELDGRRYKPESVQAETATYRALSRSPITVREVDGGKEAVIGGGTYRISEQTRNSGEPLYEVTYPDGNSAKAEQIGEMLFNLDEQGEPILLTASVEGINERSDPQIYTPSQLVTAAYPQFHEKPGNPVGFVLLLLLAVFGWCSFRYRGLQDFLFQLSVYRLWVEDPKPNDFYYAMSRVTGIGIAGISICAALMQL